MSNYQEKQELGEGKSKLDFLIMAFLLLTSVIAIFHTSFQFSYGFAASWFAALGWALEMLSNGKQGGSSRRKLEWAFCVSKDIRFRYFFPFLVPFHSLKHSTHFLKLNFHNLRVDFFFFFFVTSPEVLPESLFVRSWCRSFNQLRHANFSREMLFWCF